MNNEKNEENNFNESVLTNISDLTEEVKEKKLELESFKGQIKLLKQEYQKQLSVYFQLNKNVMQIENNIENILKEKSKIKKKITLLIVKFNSEVVKRLNDISNRPNNENIEDLILEFFEFKPISTFEELIMLNKNEEEWKILLKYSTEKKITQKQINSLKKILEKIGKDINYPYQIFIDLIKGIIRIKEIEFETIILNEQLTIENNTKNEIFLHLKNIETEIIRNDYLYKKMVKYVKQIYSMLEAFSKIRTKNDKSISEEYRILNKNIKEFKKIDFKKLIIPTDNLSSLSVRTNISDNESIYSLNTLYNIEEQKEFSSSLINSDNNNSNNLRNSQIKNNNNKKVNINNNKQSKNNNNNNISKTNSIHSINNAPPPFKMKNFQKGIIGNKSACKPKKIKRKESDDDDKYSDNENIIDNNSSIKIEKNTFVNLNDDLTHENIDGNINFASHMNLFKSLPSKFYEDKIHFQRRNEENNSLRNGSKLIYQAIDDGSSNCNVGGCCHFGAIFG